MKKIFTLLCAAVVAVSTMNAEVLFSCNFNDSTTGRLSVGAWSSGTLASDNSWYTNGSPTATDPQYRAVVEQQLTYSGYCSSTTGKAVESKRNQQKDYILFPSGKQHASLNAGEKYYMSFLFKATSLNTGTGATGGTNTYVAGLLTSATGTGIAYTNAQVMVTTVDANTFKFGIRKITETAQYAEGTFNINQTYLVVAEYIVNSGSADDVVNLYINPTKDSQTIAATNTQTSAPTDKTGIVGVGILAIGNAPESAIIDELKVATSWADLWESGEPQQETPTIIADQSFAFGDVNVNEAANKNLTIKGSNLKGAISIASDNEQVVVSATSVSKDDAEAEGGASISVTLTATAAGEGSAKITLSSEDATNKVINVTWNAVAPLPSVTNIAALKASEAGVEVELKSEPIVIGILDWNIVLQDESGAIVAQDLYDVGSAFWALQIGDKVKGLKSHILESEDFVRAFPTVTITADVAAVSSGNAITPIETNIADMNNYGPAYIKLTQVEFTDTDKDKFAQGWFYIKQGDNTARIQVPENCDIIGEAIPAKADVVGQLVYTTGGIAISSSANLTNRVARSATAIENIQSKGKAVKVVRNGQLIILRDGKEYNVLGVEK